MKKTIFVSFIFILLTPIIALSQSSLAKRLSGYILLNIDKNGEAWYVLPKEKQRIYLGRPADAFNIMKKYGIGISETDLNKFILGDINNNNQNTYNQSYINDFAANNAGKIFIQVEKNGEAWYINPRDYKKYYLGRPTDAYEIMKKLSLGITNNDIQQIPTANSQINTPENIIDSSIPAEYNLQFEFTSQAPLGNWNPPFDEACEEASLIMGANFYGLEKNISNTTIAAQRIQTLTQYVEDQGYPIDLTIEETKIIYENYYSRKALIIEDYNLDTIKKYLVNNNPIIIPLAGREIGNPYFTAPGPIYHMLIIKGYTKDNQIITHDPGTRRGANYMYDFDTLYNANHDWNAKNINSGKKGIIILQ